MLAAFAVALAVPSSSSAALLNISVYDDYYDPDSPNDGAIFEFLDVDNENVVWSWGNGSGTTANHDVVQTKGMFKSGAPKDSGTYELQASGGTYKYLCTVHQGMNASVGILPNLNAISESQIKLIWANKFTDTGKRFFVRYRIDGGKWKLWMKNTRKTRGTFGKKNKPVAADLTKHTYEFQARTYKGKPSKKRRSGWSPIAGTTL